MAQHGEPTVTVDEVAHWLGLGVYVFWVAEAGDELLAYADVSERAERTRYWLDLRSLDLARAAELLETVETWAAGRAAPAALVYGIVSAPDAALRGLYESSGYRLVRYSFEMRIDLDETPPAPTWPQGLRVRAFRPGEDDERVWQADAEAFADHWEFSPDTLDDWRREVLGHPAFDPSLSFLAVEGDEIAGLASCIVRDLGEPVGWVEVLGVRRPWRRRGLGLALLRHAFDAFEQRGLQRAGLEVDAENLTGAVRLYERAGMRVVKEAVIYEKTLRPCA